MPLLSARVLARTNYQAEILHDLGVILSEIIEALVFIFDLEPWGTP